MTGVSKQHAVSSWCCYTDHQRLLTDQFDIDPTNKLNPTQLFVHTWVFIHVCVLVYLYLLASTTTYVALLFWIHSVSTQLNSDQDFT